MPAPPPTQSYQREFLDHGLVDLALPWETLATVFVVTAVLCSAFTQLCIRVLAPWLKAKAGTLGRPNDEEKILDLSVRTTSVVHTLVIYVASIYSLVHETEVYYATPAAKIAGLGYIQPQVAMSLMAYMAVDTYQLFQRRQYLGTGAFYSVLAHHIVTFIMQPVSFWCGYWQYYGNVIVAIAECTSLFYNLNVLLPDLGCPRQALVSRINTVVFASLFIVCRVFLLTAMMFNMYYALFTDEEAKQFHAENPAVLYCTVILVSLWAVGFGWSLKLSKVLRRTLCGSAQGKQKEEITKKKAP